MNKKAYADNPRLTPFINLPLSTDLFPIILDPIHNPSPTKPISSNKQQAKAFRPDSLYLISNSSARCKN